MSIAPNSCAGNWVRPPAVSMFKTEPPRKHFEDALFRLAQTARRGGVRLSRRHRRRRSPVKIVQLGQNVLHPRQQRGSVAD